MKISKWIFDGHPQRYHFIALVLAFSALSMVLTVTIFAQSLTGTTDTTGTSSTTSTVTSCSYSYNDWGTCQSSGERYRTVKSVSPSGCIQTTAPVLMEHCTYTNSTTTTTLSAPSCLYSYSDWGMCQTSGKRSRTVVSTSPSGCVSTTAPVLEESCTYMSTTTSTTTTSPTTSYLTTTSTSLSTTGTKEGSSTTQCSYTYGEWGMCQTSGKRSRTLLSKSPSNCEEYVKPVVEQSCIYDNTVTTATPSSGTITSSSLGTTSANNQKETTSSVTPVFSFLNIEDGKIVRGNITLSGSVLGAQEVEYYLVPIGSNTYKYIGGAKVSGDSTWSMDFRSDEFPNGDFYLRAKIKNKYGEYGSGQRKITIANEGQGNEKVVVLEKDFQSLEMTKTAKVEMLNQVGQDLGVPKDETALSVNDTDPDKEKKRLLDYCETHVDQCFKGRDSDRDGLNDIDEVRYGTDPKLADSDLDGFIDGDEVKGGFDPLKYSAGDQSDRIVFESPQSAGETKKELYVVQNVALKETAEKKQGVHFSGKALPNSFVTLYVYSDPIVLTVKTDSEGNWSYELDKELEDGKHEVYVAVTDNTGKITAKSEPLFFAKTAQAVTVIPQAEAASPIQTLPVSENRAQKDLLLLVAIIIAAVAVALATLGLMKHRHALMKEEVSQP